MIPWASKKVLNASLIIALLATFSVVGFFTSPVSADAITGKHNNGLASQTERWLRLRAVAKCFNDNNVGKNSYNDVEKGAIFDSGGVAIGYLNPDGKVSCDSDGGEAFVRNSFGIIGFASPLEAFCSVQPMASRGSSDSKNESNFTGCMTGSGDEFDMDSDASDQGARQVEQFKKGYREHANDPIAWTPSASMMYHVYKSSLTRFCGAKLIGKLDPADKNNIEADARKVVVSDVDLATGDIVKNVYSLTRNQTDKIDDIFVNDRMQNVSNVTCSDMAKKTEDHSGPMAAYVSIYNKEHPDDVGVGFNEEGGNGDNEPVCSGGALGWIFCPLVDFMGTATNKVAEYLEDRLVFAPLLESSQGTAIKTVWDSLLTIANAGLIIAFLIIIFSQATSLGLSSYGIKKLMPKVVIAAILMNLSFYICAIAIDIANILGVSIQGIVQAGISSIGSAAGTSVQSGASGIQWAVTLTVLISALTVSIFTGAIFLLLPVLASALVAVFTAFLILAARDVMITLLVIVSPLAFLAMILPNTDQWFTKWRKLFTSMLLLFPLIMAIFYGSVLVANMILITGEGGSDNEVGFMTNLIALAVLTIPLFSLPFIMKSAGGVLDRWGAVVNNRNKGLVDRSRKVGTGLYGAKKDTRRMNAFNGGKTLNPFKMNMRRQATRDHRRALRKGVADENAQEYIAKKALAGGSSRLSYAGRMVNSSDPSYIAAVQASAQATVDKQDRQSVANREVLLRTRYRPEESIVRLQDDLTRELTKAEVDVTAARAMQNILIGSGSKGIAAVGDAYTSAETNDEVKARGGVQASALGELKKDLNSAGLKGKDNALAMYAFNDQPLSEIRVDAKTYSGLTDAEFVGQSQKNIEAAVAAKAITPERAQKILESDALRGALDSSKRKQIEKLLVNGGSLSGSSSQIIIPRTNTQTQTPPTPTQQQRQQGDNFNNGPSNPNPPTST